MILSRRPQAFACFIPQTETFAPVSTNNFVYLLLTDIATLKSLLFLFRYLGTLPEVSTRNILRIYVSSGAVFFRCCFFFFFVRDVCLRIVQGCQVLTVDSISLDMNRNGI